MRTGRIFEYVGREREIRVNKVILSNIILTIKKLIEKECKDINGLD